MRLSATSLTCCAHRRVRLTLEVSRDRGGRAAWLCKRRARSDRRLHRFVRLRAFPKDAAQIGRTTVPGVRRSSIHLLASGSAFPSRTRAGRGQGRRNLRVMAFGRTSLVSWASSIALVTESFRPQCWRLVADDLSEIATNGVPRGLSPRRTGAHRSYMGSGRPGLVSSSSSIVLVTESFGLHCRRSAEDDLSDIATDGGPRRSSPRWTGAHGLTMASGCPPSGRLVFSHCPCDGRLSTAASGIGGRRHVRNRDGRWSAQVVTSADRRARFVHGEWMSRVWPSRPQALPLRRTALDRSVRNRRPTKCPQFPVVRKAND